ncbi:MAG: hypothetical protein WCA35_17560 [Kovacikia sp.]
MTSLTIPADARGKEAYFMKFGGTYTDTYCRSESELSVAGKIRYQAYQSVDAIESNERMEFLDKYDRQGNSATCLINKQGEPVAAIRASVYAAEYDFAPTPCLEVYKEDLERHMGDLNKTIVESNRFVVLPEITDSKKLFKLQFRFIILNALKHNADYIVTAVRPRHVPFYRRIMMFPISDPKKYSGINVEMVLLAANSKDDLQKVIGQDPLYYVSQDEIERYSIRSLVNKLKNKNI